MVPILNIYVNCVQFLMSTINCELEHARVHPKFLHSNATSHKWAFGAIAELLDNAVDEQKKKKKKKNLNPPKILRVVHIHV
ncbi:hypothetical protein HanHA89_Chr09g0343641 [Helianthus annuus]|nr:hypothetical protein HanHA89_Chr09g0343641 [Helianthus annuus]